MKRNKHKMPAKNYAPDKDENFAFIAGYTSGGFPYGITWKEQEENDIKEIASLNDGLRETADTDFRETPVNPESNESFSDKDMPELPF